MDIGLYNFPALLFTTFTGQPPVSYEKMTLKQYHDAILHENCLSVEMLRAILTNQPLKRDFKTNWRFYKK